MKSPNLASPPLPASGHWDTRIRQLAHGTLSPAAADRSVGPQGQTFDDSRHPLLVIANRIAVCFLGVTVIGFLVLIADALLTRI